MTDCAHWIPIILEDERHEHRQMRVESQRKLGNMKRVIDDIRAIINAADADLTDFHQSPVDRQRWREALMQQQLAAMRPSNHAALTGQPLQGTGLGSIFDIFRR